MEDSSPNQASLTVLGGPKGGQRFLIEESVDNIVIGSDPSCRFHINLPGVSPVHARLWVDPQGVTVYETNSPHGLYVNDDRVVAQASLRNGDILWLGTPGDEDVVMIQCRLPQAGVQARAVPLPIAEEAIRETVALSAFPADASEASEAEPMAEVEVMPEPEVASDPVVEPEPEVTLESEPEQTRASFVDTPSSAAPATEVFMVDESLYMMDESLYGSPPSPPLSAPAAEPAHFEMDFTKPMSSFEEELSAPAPEPTQAMSTSPTVDETATLTQPAPPTPSAPAPPSYPPPTETARARETPAPVRAEPPPPPRRPTPRAPPATVPPPAPETAPARASAAVKYGLIGIGIVVVAVGSLVAVRPRRAPAPIPSAPPPTTVAPAPPSTEAPAPVETPPAESAPPSAVPAPPATIPEEVVDVPQTMPAPVRPLAAATRPPTPAARPSAAERPTPRPAITPSVAATPPPVAAVPPAQQSASQVASLLGQAAAAVSARQFDAALAAFDEALKLDPQNASAGQGKAAAQAAAASYQRSFAAGRTSLGGKEAKADLGGFDTSGVKVAKVPDYSSRIEFEVTPPRVLPGDSYTVRIFLVNDGKKAFKIGSVTVATLVNGTRSGGPIAARAREIEPRDRVLLDERTAEWAAGTTSWTLEAVVGSDRNASFTNRLNWR